MQLLPAFRQLPLKKQLRGITFSVCLDLPLAARLSEWTGRRHLPNLWYRFFGKMKKNIPIQQIPLKSRSITAIGDKTTEAAIRLFPDGSLFDDDDHGLNLDPLTEAFKKAQWTDDEAAEVISHYANERQAGRQIDIKTLARWVLHHPNASYQVNECLVTRPPEEIEIIKVLSRAGSQKVVFLATWLLTQADIVLKKVVASTEATQRILSRELRANPLNMVHQNIIETYILKNSEGEAFLVEKKLSEVLSDTWRANGVHEASNLLFDIGKAITFLHQKDLVHGDIKPDNIGKSGDTYILLDFGICRERDAFTAEATPTGSLRTRAPELLKNSTPAEPEKVDVWALGATVYNSIAGRFPLVSSTEIIPRISQPKERAAFERILADRADKEWDKWLDFSEIPDPINGILQKMLSRDPNDRLTSKQLLELAKKELSAFVRSNSVRGDASARFSPIEELNQLSQYVRTLQHSHAVLPANKHQIISNRLEELKKIAFTTDERDILNQLVASLP